MKVIRNVVAIDADKCNGCGFCVVSCPENALDVVDEKARLVSDELCAGEGACVDLCERGALSLAWRPWAPFSEVAVLRALTERLRARERARSATGESSRRGSEARAGARRDSAGKRGEREVERN
ncbi:MAG: hypothetical protein Kow0069_15370 [Promethearchaeota archaeon]